MVKLWSWCWDCNQLAKAFVCHWLLYIGFVSWNIKKMTANSVADIRVHRISRPGYLEQDEIYSSSSSHRLANVIVGPSTCLLKRASNTSLLWITAQKWNGNNPAIAFNFFPPNSESKNLLRLHYITPYLFKTTVCIFSFLEKHLLNPKILIAGKTFS